MQLTVTISGNREEIAKFKKLGDSLTDFSSAMKTVGTELKTYYSETVFASGGGALGTKWDALSPVYRNWKSRHYPGKGILVASGRLKKGVRETHTRNSATIDNPTPYFNYLQTGTRHMPSRPMLAINKSVEDIAQHIIEDDIKHKLKAVA